MFRQAWARLSVLLVVLLLAMPVASAGAGPRHYTVTGWSMEQGLPHPLVHSVAQDRDGFLWVGTWEGVVRFNGRDFSLFDRQNTPGVELAGVFSIVPEADGGVLFGTARDGLFRYHEGRWQRLGGPSATKLRVIAMLRDRRDGVLWIASGSRLLRLAADGRLSEVGAGAGLPRAEITVLAQDAAGNLLVGGEKGVFQWGPGGARRWGADWIGSAPVRGLVADGAGGWLVASDDGVRWRHANGRVEHLFSGQRASAAIRDARGVLWVNLSSGGLQRRDPDGSVRSMSVPGVLGTALMVDREGLVWTGSTDGLYRVADGMASGLTRKDGLGSDYVRAILQDSAGAYWIGHTNGLSRWAQGRLEAIGLEVDGVAQGTSVLALAWKDDALWVGTYDRGVFQLDPQGRVREHIRVGEGVQPLVRALLPESDGSVWIGGSHGLALYRDGRLRSYIGGGQRPAATVQALYRDPGGALWIGSDNGMARLDARGTLRSWQPGPDFPAQNVFDFLRDKSGDLWVATDRGLLRMRGGTFRMYDHRVGLPRDKLFRIIDDKAGNFWLSSNMGVFRVARRELDEVDAGTRRLLAVHVIDRSDGMPGSQCNGASMPAGWRGMDGTLLFPTSAGVALIDPSSAGSGRVGGPPVAFESVTVDGVQQRLAPALRLSPGANRLAIGYAGMSFRALDKLRYRYRLHGFDPEWVDAGTSTEAVYTRLPPGSYRLEVQAMPLPLDWNRKGEVGSTSLQLEVLPALWQRPAVRALAVFASLLVAVLLGWMRTASYRRRQIRLSQEIAERTEELREKNRQLQTASFQLQYQASHDDLTRLPNRRAGDRHFNEAVARAHAAQRPLSVVLLDIDRFKQVNDQYGHAAGDAVLQAFGGLLARFVAEHGLFAARFGGEEFLVCLESLGLHAAEQRMQDLLERVRSHEIPVGGGTVLRCTFSAGIAELTPGQAAHALLAQADDRLRRAKQAGRDRIEAD